MGKFGGAYMGRTYGPLIKNERRGLTQVVQGLGHPLVNSANLNLPFVSLCLILRLIVGHCLSR